MKLLTTFGFLMFFLLGVNAQDFDTRLFKKYSQSELQELKDADPAKLELITYALDHGMYVTENENVKGVELTQIAAPNEGETFLDLGLELTSQNQYFQIIGENKILVIKSLWVLNNELETK